MVTKRKVARGLLSVLTPRPMRLVVKVAGRLRKMAKYEKGRMERLKRTSEYKYGNPERARMTRRAMYRGGPLE